MGTPNRSRVRAAQLRQQLADARAGRVLMVSHCLLNENVRYLGGAARPGVVDEIVDVAREYDVALHQVPCPEMRAWGGVDRKALLLMFGAQGSTLHRRRRQVLAVFKAYTRLAYLHLARQVVRDVKAYRAAGVDVVGLVGVAASPSCGVRTTLDLDHACEMVATCPLAQIDRTVVNEQAVRGSATPGTGVFVELVRRGFRRRGLDVPLFEHDQPAEVSGGHALPTGLRERLARR